ncbi:hypothetical protein EMIT0158MI4_100124 [Burkholderia ambifaria]
MNSCLADRPATLRPLVHASAGTEANESCYITAMSGFDRRNRPRRCIHDNRAAGAKGAI